MESLLEKAASGLLKSHYAISLTGAGISTESGISDFRGPDGLWTKNPDAERMAYQTYNIFLSDPKEYWKIRLTQPYILGSIEDAKPNAGHYALAELEQMNILKCVITQNIDGLHVKAGNKKVLEYHGSIFKLRCPSCGTRYNQEEYDLEGLLKKDELPPLCVKCNAPIKADVVHFNEPIPSDVTQGSLKEASRCDFMLICGTSAVVYPFASLPQVARQKNVGIGTVTGLRVSLSSDTTAVTIVEVNAEPTPLTDTGISNYIIQGKTAEILPKLVEYVKKLLE